MLLILGDLDNAVPVYSNLNTRSLDFDLTSKMLENEDEPSDCANMCQSRNHDQTRNEC